MLRANEFLKLERMKNSLIWPRYFIIFPEQSAKKPRYWHPWSALVGDQRQDRTDRTRRRTLQRPRRQEQSDQQRLQHRTRWTITPLMPPSTVAFSKSKCTYWSSTYVLVGLVLAWSTDGSSLTLALCFWRRLCPGKLPLLRDHLHLGYYLHLMDNPNLRYLPCIPVSKKLKFSTDF